MGQRDLKLQLQPRIALPNEPNEPCSQVSRIAEGVNRHWVED